MTNTTLYFAPSAATSLNKFCSSLQEMICQTGNRPVVFLCIGSDRATGDSLGPLVGHQLITSLSLSHCTKKTAVYGSLRHTVHAGNLSDTLSSIYNRYSNPFIIAIDASLGVPEHIGFVTLGTGSLRPGIGVSHKLPAAGDIHITGIVNHSSTNNHLTLQTTKLLTVAELAGFISHGILRALHVCSSLQSPQERHFIDIF
jgi:putative sporulation protein YyaC